MLSETEVQRLCQLGWGTRDLALGERADFKCEYCQRNLLGSVEDYKLWEIDHIIPTHLGGADDLENWAVSCLVCNFKLKGRWDPRNSAESLGREDLIYACKTYIDEVRKNNELRLEEIVSIIETARKRRACAATAGI